MSDIDPDLEPSAREEYVPRDMRINAATVSQEATRRKRVLGLKSAVRRCAHAARSLGSAEPVSCYTALWKFRQHIHRIRFRAQPSDRMYLYITSRCAWQGPLFAAHLCDYTSCVSLYS